MILELVLILRYNVAGQPSGREPLPNFYVRSKNKKNLKVQNFKQWLSLWENAKERRIPENMHLNILYQRIKIIKETYLI